MPKRLQDRDIRHKHPASCFHCFVSHQWGKDQDQARAIKAQLAALGLENVQVASAVDYGDTQSPLGNIHPRNKVPVGQRLAQAAVDLVYGGAKYAVPAAVSAASIARTNGPPLIPREASPSRR